MVAQCAHLGLSGIVSVLILVTVYIKDPLPIRTSGFLPLVDFTQRRRTPSSIIHTQTLEIDRVLVTRNFHRNTTLHYFLHYQVSRQYFVCGFLFFSVGKSKTVNFERLTNSIVYKMRRLIESNFLFWPSLPFS